MHNHPARLHQDTRFAGSSLPLDVVINGDGSVSPKGAPHLCYGLRRDVLAIHATSTTSASPGSQAGVGSGGGGGGAPETGAAGGRPVQVHVVQATPVPTMASVSAAGAVAPGVVIASTIGPAASSSTAPLLAEMCETFRVQLGLSHESSIKEVVEAAADMLGVRKDDKPLIELATRCWEELGLPPGEKI